MEEKIALVTGASRGIGSQIAKTLAKKNIFVVVNYSGSKEKAEQTAEEIINAGGKAVVYGCDISDFYATERYACDRFRLSLSHPPYRNRTERSDVGFPG